VFMPERQTWFRFGYDVHSGGDVVRSPAADADLDTWTAAQLMAEIIESEDYSDSRSNDSACPD
jgi:hypothetical protein